MFHKLILLLCKVVKLFFLPLTELFRMKAIFVILRQLGYGLNKHLNYLIESFISNILVQK